MSIPLRPGPLVRASRSSVYREFPSAAPAVACTWEGEAGWARELRALPDGCADLVFGGGRLTIVPSRPAPVRYRLDAGAGTVGVRLRPGTAGTVFGLPMSALDGELPLDAVAPGARALERRLADHRSTVDRRAMLERYVRGEPDPLAAAAVRGLERWSVDRTASAVGLSPRELRRRFHAAVGYGPKALQRVLRFRRFVGRLDSVACGRTTLAAVAAELGYADQAHLGRECRALSGSSPTALLACWRPAETF